jgi:cation transport ATPase
LAVRHLTPPLLGGALEAALCHPVVRLLTLRDVLLLFLVSPLQLKIITPLYASGVVAAVKSRRANSDTQVVISSVAAYAYSLALSALKAAGIHYQGGGGGVDCCNFN